MLKLHLSRQAILTLSNFIPTDRKTDYLLPPSVDDWLTQDHLARFVVEVIDGLDLSRLTRQYAGRGSKAHHPATLLAILVYGYSTGVFSSRKLQMATYDSVAFRYIVPVRKPLFIQRSACLIFKHTAFFFHCYLLLSVDCQFLIPLCEIAHFADERSPGLLKSHPQQEGFARVCYAASL